jgi:cytochrome P450
VNTTSNDFAKQGQDFADKTADKVQSGIRDARQTATKVGDKLSSEVEGARSQSGPHEAAMNSAIAAETPIPTGVKLTPFDEAFRNDPYPVLERLRDAEPIHRDEALSRWFVTEFENVREVLRNKDLSNEINKTLPNSYAGRIAANAKESGMSITIGSMIFMDDR